MALVFGLKKGKRVLIGDTVMEVSRIISPRCFEVTVYLPTMVKVYQITDLVKTEILPNVFVSSGVDGTFHLARVVIDAPKSVNIKRLKGNEDAGK